MADDYRILSDICDPYGMIMIPPMDFRLLTNAVDFRSTLVASVHLVCRPGWFTLSRRQ